MKPFTSVVLAGDRGPGDPVALAAGVPCKAFVPVGGRPMVLRVLDALAEARAVDARVICGPPRRLLPRAPELDALVASGAVEWVPNRSTPSSSVAGVLASLPEDTPVLVTTSDHALLTAETVDHFCRDARGAACDVAVGLMSHERVSRAYPETRRTATRFRDGGVCSCNLFAFLTPRGRAAADFWRKYEGNRKKPWRVMGAVGWPLVIRYLLGRLSLRRALDTVSARMGLTVKPVMLPFPEAAIDVDSVADWRLVEGIVEGRRSGPH